MFPEDQMLFTLLIQVAKRNYWFRGWLTNLQWETEVNLTMSLHVLARLHCQCISSMSWGSQGGRCCLGRLDDRELRSWWPGGVGMEQKPLIVGTSLCCNFFWRTVVQIQCAQHVDGGNYVTPLPKFFTPLSRNWSSNSVQWWWRLKAFTLQDYIEKANKARSERLSSGQPLGLRLKQ